MLSEDPDFWARVTGRLLHPVQMTIVEALLWVERPLSASEVTKILEGSVHLSGVAYHFRRLAGLEVIKPTRTVQVRGALKRPFRLAQPGE